MTTAAFRQEYAAFLEKKGQIGTFSGFEPVWLPDFLFDFQRALVDWAVRKGKAAIFSDCGTGKTPMELVWAENVVRKTGGRVLILTPLAVSYQTIREAEKFGIEARRSVHGETVAGINVANYEKLHLFDSSDFVGVIADESSILKSFDGVTRKAVTEFMRRIPYRLLATATAAPNDYVELGTSSEALGEMGYMDMLNRFFKNEQNTSDTRRKWVGQSGRDGIRWRFKGHAEIPFWRWVASWARALRRPSDLGFDDDGFILPPLLEREHVVTAATLAPGMLFALPAVGLREQREERRRTIGERCEKVADLVAADRAQCLVWCHLNIEGDRLAEIIPGSVQVSGADSDEEKEARLLGFAQGEIRVLVTKPRIAGYGLNLQSCAHVTFFPSHSYEQYYQGVRRCWRFGQSRAVIVDIVATEGERDVLTNLQRKAAASDRMFSALVSEMGNAAATQRASIFTEREEVPPWI